VVLVYLSGNLFLSNFGKNILHNKKLYALYSSPNIIRVIKSRRLRWAGHVARMEERRDAYRVSVGNLRAGDHLEDPGVDGRIIIKWIFERLGGG
jgi:hypothetical protein